MLVVAEHAGSNQVVALRPPDSLIVEAALVFVFVLVALEGEFADRIARMSASTSIPFILGGAALGWMGK